MLRVREIRDDGPDRTIFRIADGELPPAPESLARLVAVASLLIAENGLSGSFRVSNDAEILLEVPAAARHFLHEGIVFAALDAVNDPVKSPTLTLLSEGEPGP